MPIAVVVALVSLPIVLVFCAVAAAPSLPYTFAAACESVAVAAVERPSPLLERTPQQSHHAHSCAAFAFGLGRPLLAFVADAVVVVVTQSIVRQCSHRAGQLRMAGFASATFGCVR